MKINYLPRCDILIFEKTHDLELVVHERAKRMSDFTGYQFYCKFNNAEISDGFCLAGKFGNGNTPDEAIKNYCLEIGGGQTLVVGAYSEQRKEIVVPYLSYDSSTKKTA